MPKLLVLFDAHREDITLFAEAVAEGARSVRFTEVDVRRISGTAPDGDRVTRHRALEGPEAIAAYDGVVLGVGVEPSGKEGAFETLAATASVMDKVGSAFTETTLSTESRRDVLWSVLTPMLDRGMILVQPAASHAPANDVESAREQGKRVAQVIGWVTHARSHHHHH